MKRSIDPYLQEHRFVRTNRFVRAAALAIVFSSLTASSSFAARARLTVSVSPTIITNEGEQAIITITASSPPTRNLKVKFLTTGNAILNLDYLLIAPTQVPQIIVTPSLIFPAGQSSIQVVLQSMGGEDRFPLLFANFHLLPGGRYRVGHPRLASVKIVIPQPSVAVR
jgi:hypothetical protein